MFGFEIELFTFKRMSAVLQTVFTPVPLLSTLASG